MSTNLLGPLAILVAALILAAIVCGVFASSASVSPRKGRLYFAGVLLFGSAFLLFGVTRFIWLYNLPILDAEGIIQSAIVHRDGKGYRTDLVFADVQGPIYLLYADGRSDYFRPGEQAVLTYRGYARSIVKVHFITQSGAEEGVFQSTAYLQPCLAILLGCMTCGAAYIRYRRDPEGARES
jgi:hypothetical protein